MHEHHSSRSSRLPRWLRLHPLLLGLIALIWIALRSGRKPTRLAYPCQRAALGTAAMTLAGPLAAALLGAAAAIGARRRLGAPALAVLAMLLLAVFGGLAHSGRTVAAAGSGFAARGPDSDYIANIYVVEAAGGPSGLHHTGLDVLLACMGAGDLKFYRSPIVSPESGPTGIVGADDVVLIKINQQWPERGGTNTDVLKGLIARITEHPDGFTGEIVVIENTQGMGTLDWPNSNAEDHSQSALDVINLFAGLGWPVSGQFLDNFRTISVAEYVDGDMRDGYVVGPLNSTTQIRPSHPKFQTAEGTYVSLKHGIWDPGSGTYDDSRLTFINVPILKCHGAVYGVTACLKHHVGTMTTALSTNTHNAVRFGGLGTFLAEVRMADLNILDCIYILARPNAGPWCTYGEATHANKLVAGIDPVAIDMWATTNILVPAIIANGYTTYPMQDPSDPQSIFRRYLDLAMNQLLAAGIEATNVLTQIEARVCQGAGIEPAASPAPPGEVVVHPNPAPSGGTVHFQVPEANELEIRIYDASGRLVRILGRSVVAGAGRELSWDGRDHHGDPLPAGTYAYEVRGGTGPATGKVTLVR